MTEPVTNLTMETETNITPSKEETKTEEQSSGSNWWSSWSTTITNAIPAGIMDTVKEKSEQIVKIYKEDIQEFTKTIQHDTQDVIKNLPQETAHTQEKVKSQISGLTGLLSSLVNFDEETSDKKQDERKEVIVDRTKAKLMGLQSDLNTYCTDPSETQEFNDWKSTFQVNANTEIISNLLSTSDVVRDAHTKLVPTVVTYTQFWERYFFKLNKLNQEEERRAALVKRATDNAAEEEEVGWDVEDEPEQEKPAIEEKKEEVEKFLDSLEETPKGNSAENSETVTEKTEKPKRERKEGSDPVEDDWESWE